MSDTLKVPLFDIAHVRQDEVTRLRRALPPVAYPALRRFRPWALAFLLVGLAGLAVTRHLIKA